MYGHVVHGQLTLSNYFVQGKTQADLSAGTTGEGQTVMAMMVQLEKDHCRQYSESIKDEYILYSNCDPSRYLYPTPTQSFLYIIRAVYIYASDAVW